MSELPFMICYYFFTICFIVNSSSYGGFELETEITKNDRGHWRKR